MPTKTWKSIELKVAEYVGGKRRGADFRDKYSGGGKSDIILQGYSIEVKHSRRPTYGLMKGALEQANTNKEEGEIPIAIIHKEGTGIEDCLVIISMQTLLGIIQKDVTTSEAPTDLK